MLTLLFATGARADTWLCLGTVTVASPSGNYVAIVTPGSGPLFGGYAERLQIASATPTFRFALSISVPPTSSGKGSS
jgi:hypothetical protein